jgi:hypothetical protein
MTRHVVAIAALAGFVVLLAVAGMPVWGIVACVAVLLATVTIAIGRPRLRRRP